MPLKPLFIALLICSCITANAQRQNVYYMKNNGKEVSSKDSADYIRVVSEPDSGSTLYNLKEFYPKGNPKLIGKTSKIDYNSLDGWCLAYYPNGKKKWYTQYKAGNAFGDSFEYFPNGKLYLAKRYVDIKFDKLKTDYLIELCNDSTGKALVTDGNGYYVGYDDDFKTVYEQGNVKDGLRDGEWKGREENKHDTIIFVEQYDKGSMISGSATDKSKQVYPYTRRQVEPQFKGGMDALYNYLGNKIEYPDRAARKGIQGMVMLKFVVEKDGSITDIEVLKTPSPDLSDEAIRVLKKSPKWTPGIFFGRTARVQYTLPVNFSR
jgi:TonB family protein